MRKGECVGGPSRLDTDTGLSEACKYSEDFLSNTRKYISRLPDNNEAILLLSGGLDSVVAGAFCMADRQGNGHEFLNGLGLEIHPIFFRRGQKAQDAEERSVDFFDSFFSDSKEFKDRYHHVIKVDAPNPYPEFRSNTPSNLGIPMRQMIMIGYAVQYAYRLDGERAKEIGVAVKNLPDREKMRSIYLAEFGERCSTPYPHSKPAALRVVTMDICLNTSDPLWQVTSPIYDPMLQHNLMDKPMLIKWALGHDLPIERTMSCYKPVKAEESDEVQAILNGKDMEAEYVHCGRCLSCKTRREAFSRTEFPDPTEYASESKVSRKSGRPGGQLDERLVYANNG